MSNPPEKKPPGKKIPPLQIPPDLVPNYANLVRITHSPSELVFDFSRFLPGDSPPKVLDRIIMSPLSAKLFFKALGENLSKYEALFGEIKISGGNSTLADNLFRPQKK